MSTEDYTGPTTTKENPSQIEVNDQETIREFGPKGKTQLPQTESEQKDGKETADGDGFEKELEHKGAGEGSDFHWQILIGDQQKATVALRKISPSGTLPVDKSPKGLTGDETHEFELLGKQGLIIFFIFTPLSLTRGPTLGVQIGRDQRRALCPKKEKSESKQKRLIPRRRNSARKRLLL